MRILKDNPESERLIKSILANIPSLLTNVNSDEALIYTKWLLEKTKHIRDHSLGNRFPYLPNNISRGDIVLVRLGFNIGAELSDTNEESEGHFGLVWGQQGQQIIIIPLTKQPQPSDNKYGANLGIIKGLPKRKQDDGTYIDVDTYAKIDAIRSVHLRRISRIKGQFKEGKITITEPKILKRISDIFLEYFVNGTLN